jgi:tripartite-type tricarboxylate transporter receptor subunit TctC
MKWTGKFAAVLVALAGVSQAFAQANYPNKPVRWIIPYAAGGGTDVIARPISVKLGDALKQTIIYENKGGAGGFLAAQDVAKAVPDGYTFLVAAGNTHIFSTLLYDKPPFDPVKDFSPVTNFAIIPNILVANPKFGPNNLKELVAFGKANPGKINWASSGNGAGGHLGLVLFAKNTGINVVHVPFKGAGPAHASVLGGETPLLLANTGVFLANIKAGKLKVLGVAASKRIDVLPDVQTFAEQGFPLESASFYGLMAPAKTPAAAIKKMHDEIVKILNTADEKKRLADNGAFPVGDTPEQFAAFLKREVDTWGPVIRENGIKPD